ncbi:MAG: DUF3999 family protein [Spirochaetes bacterium]|nr:DUF3999 family protein [Spirochaetota bacterium]
MKRIAVTAALLVAAPLLSWHAGNFRYESDLGNLAPATLYRVTLDAPVLERSAPGGDDIRVFDEGGREIPCVVIVHRAAPPPAPADLELVGYDQGTRTVMARFTGAAETVNTVTLDISDEDFRRQCLVYGSDDGVSWRFLRQGLIYDYSSQVSLRSTSLRIPESSFRYYRVTLRGAAPGGRGGMRLTYGGMTFSADGTGERVLRVDGITVSRVPDGPTVQPLHGKTFRDPAATQDRESTGIVVEANLPVDRVSFDITSPFYHRKIFMYGGETAEAKSFFTEGTVFRFPGLVPVERRDHLYCSAEKHRYYRFKIQNDDSPALAVGAITLEWFPRYLFFMSGGAGRYTLSFGNPRVPRPQYDLAAFVTRENWTGRRYTDITRGRITERRDFRPSRLDGIRGCIERWVLIAVVALLAAVLGFWLYRLARRAG